MPSIPRVLKMLHLSVGAKVLSTNKTGKKMYCVTLCALKFRLKNNKIQTCQRPVHFQVSLTLTEDLFIFFMRLEVV